MKIQYLEALDGFNDDTGQAELERAAAQYKTEVKIKNSPS